MKVQVTVVASEVRKCSKKFRPRFRHHTGCPLYK